MSYKDFEFLRRKEFLILCILLIFLTFSQIALEISSKKVKTIEQVTTFIKLNHILIELIGLLLPVFVSIFFIIKYKTKKNFLQISTREYFIVLIFILFFFFVIPIPELFEEEEEPEMTPGNTTILTSIPTSPTSNVQPPGPGNDPDLPEYNPINTTLLNNFLTAFRNVLIFLILILPILIILLIQKKTKGEELPSEIKEEIDEEGDDKEQQYRIRSILECYYQASTVLEEKGADRSISFTPTEFNSDVIIKKLSRPSRISGLTELFEEAKFSDHDMSLNKVETAKTFASKIIFNSEDDNNRTQENGNDKVMKNGEEKKKDQ